MQPGLITSFTIGGMLLISLLAFNVNMSSTTQQTTLTTINQLNVDNIAQVLEMDFKRIGFNDVNESETFEKPVLSSSDSVHIEFIINDSNDTIEWYADPGDLVTNTTNPDDYYLYREENGVVTSFFPVVYFDIKYLVYSDVTRSWTETANPENAKRFIVEFVLESGETIRQKNNVDATYHLTAWKRTYTPNNINKPW
jgi:hypothetical protein